MLLEFISDSNIWESLDCLGEWGDMRLFLLRKVKRSSRDASQYCQKILKPVQISWKLNYAYTIVHNLLCKISWNQKMSWRLASLREFGKRCKNDKRAITWKIWNVNVAKYSFLEWKETWKPSIILKFYLKIQILRKSWIWHLIFQESNLTRYVQRQINYFQDIFQNGRQKWVSFFIDHLVCKHKDNLLGGQFIFVFVPKTGIIIYWMGR